MKRSAFAQCFFQTCCIVWIAISKLHLICFYWHVKGNPVASFGRKGNLHLIYTLPFGAYGSINRMVFLPTLDASVIEALLRISEFKMDNCSFQI